MEDPHEELMNSYEIRKKERWKQFSEAFHKRFVEGDKSSDWRKPLSDKLDDIFELNSSYNKLMVRNDREGGDVGDKGDNISDNDASSCVSSDWDSELNLGTSIQKSHPGSVNPIKRRAAFLQKYGPHSSNNCSRSNEIQVSKIFCPSKSVDGKGVKSKKVRIHASDGGIAPSSVKQTVTEPSPKSVKSECLIKTSENITASTNHKQSKDVVSIPMLPPTLTPKSAARTLRQGKIPQNVRSLSASPFFKPNDAVEIVQKKAVQLVDYSDTEMSGLSLTSHDNTSSSRSSMSGKKRKKSVIPSSLKRKSKKINSGVYSSSISSFNSYKTEGKGIKKKAASLRETEKTDLDKSIKTKNLIGFLTDDTESGKTNKLHCVELSDEETESRRSRFSTENVFVSKEDKKEIATLSRTTLTKSDIDKIKNCNTLCSFSKSTEHSKEGKNEAFNLKESFTFIDISSNEIPKSQASAKNINKKVVGNNIVDENNITHNIEDKKDNEPNQSENFVHSEESIVGSCISSKISRTRRKKYTTNNLDLTNIIPDIPSKDNSNISSERRVTRSIHKNFDNIQRESDIHKEFIAANISHGEQTTVIEKKRFILGISEGSVNSQNSGKCKEYPISTTKDKRCDSLISKQPEEAKSRDGFQAKENGDKTVKTPSGLWKVDGKGGSILENRVTEDNDVKKRHLRKECSLSEVTVSVSSDTGAASLSQKFKTVTSVLKLIDGSTSPTCPRVASELKDISQLSLLDEIILSDSSGKRITRSHIRATSRHVAALKPSSISLSTSASVFPNETSSQSADSISVVSDVPAQIFTSVCSRKVNDKKSLTNVSKCAKKGAVRTASSTPNGTAFPQPEELDDFFSPIQASSKNVDTAEQSNFMTVNSEANSNQAYRLLTQNFENCVRQAVTNILSSFLPSLTAFQGQSNIEQTPAASVESLIAQQQRILSSNLAGSNLSLQTPFCIPSSMQNLSNGISLVQQPTPGLPAILLPSVFIESETNKKKELIYSSAKQNKKVEESPKKSKTLVHTEHLEKKKNLSPSPVQGTTKKGSSTTDEVVSSLIHSKESLQKLAKEKEPQIPAIQRLRPASMKKQIPEMEMSPVLNRKQVKLIDPENSMADLLKRRSNSFPKKKRSDSVPVISPTFVSDSKKKNLNVLKGASSQLYEAFQLPIHIIESVHSRNLSRDVKALKLRRHSDKEKSLSSVRNKPIDQSILDTINRFKQPLDEVEYDGPSLSQSLFKKVTAEKPFSSNTAKKKLPPQKISSASRQDDLESPILSCDTSDDNSITRRSKKSAIVRKKFGEKLQFQQPIKSPIFSSCIVDDDSRALRSRESTLITNKSAGTFPSVVSNESQQENLESPIISSNVSSDSVSLRPRRSGKIKIKSALKREKSISKKKPPAPNAVKDTKQVDLERSLFSSKYDFTPQTSGGRSTAKDTTVEKSCFRKLIAQKKTVAPMSTKKNMNDNLGDNTSEEENMSPKSRWLTTPRRCVSHSKCSFATPHQAFKDSRYLSKATKRKLWEPIDSTSDSGRKKNPPKRLRKVVEPKLIQSNKIDKNTSRYHLRKQKKNFKSKKNFESPKLSSQRQSLEETQQNASGSKKTKLSEDRYKKVDSGVTRISKDDLRFETFSSRVRNLSDKKERQPFRNLSGLPSSIINALCESDSDEDDEGADFLLN